MKTLFLDLAYLKIADEEHRALTDQIRERTDLKITFTVLYSILIVFQYFQICVIAMSCDCYQWILNTTS